ncbi:redoxin domain-containing protein [Micromonospora tulbaghiae]|uniref:AhpC/TSA family protein n=1 Tax=Micromonospora tulbaghiae TaxID=479978 RepID=A0AAW4JBY2_9ACTN|nr:redoxin domain-containing protein [Micromonospora tulbaghiae]MBO4138805.1 redoxin domain-containing protein [Micromonospora tulbaghiae]SCF01950.1 AhpC/TSA family protein [Micromonospora tulbaghiae]
MTGHVDGAEPRLPPIDVDRWVNSAPLTPEDLRGRVVLVDVWEYTCVNWIRTAPYVRAWHRDYRDLGLTVIGAHAPEFAFGRLPENIDRAIRDHGLTYPIAIDDDYTFWRALRNDAWPAKYLFDADGRLAGRWVGEGDYDRTEALIRRLVEAAAPATALPPVTAEVTAFVTGPQPTYAGITPETYLGAVRGVPGTYALTGDWRVEDEYVEAGGPGAELVLPFTAGEVNLVADPGPEGPAGIRVLLDGKPAADARGADVGPDDRALVDRAAMIRLVDGATAGEHRLTLRAERPGLRAYVFTFGP